MLQSAICNLLKEEEWAAKMVHFMDDKKVSRLPPSPKCPSLIKLYLQGNYELTAIPPLFFHRMALLQVLDLSHTSIKSLPKSLPKLVALKKLLLRGCHLFMELSPHVGKLKNLEELDLDETQIMDLPREVGKLLNLRHLRVSVYPICGKMKSKSNIMILPETISNLPQLNDLSIDVDPADKRWDDAVEVVVREASNSKTLRSLSLHLPKFQLLGYMSLIYPSLSRFRLIVGHITRKLISRVPQEVEAQFRNWEKCLKFVNGENIPTEIKGILKYCNLFFLDHHATAMNLSEFGIENMKKLKCCLLAECNKMETIIDGKRPCEESEDYSVENAVLWSLEYLGIYYMENLGSIWTGPTRYGCMSKLKFLALHSCPRLSNVFPPTLLENLINLEEFILEDCPLVTSLVSDTFVKPTMPYEFLPSLQRLLLLYLPELVSISKDLIIAPKLESIGFYNCPKLKRISQMELSSKTLKIIKGERLWWEDMKWNETEWGNRPEYLMRIFSPINNEEDVMTQMTKDRVLFEVTPWKEGQKLDNCGLLLSDYPEKSIIAIDVAELSDCKKENILATNLMESTSSTPEQACSFSSEKGKRLENDKFDLPSEICEVDDNEEEPKSKRLNYIKNETKGVKDCVIKTARHTIAFRVRNELLDDGYRWRKYGKKRVKNSPHPRNYFRCTSMACTVKKRVEQDTNDRSFSIVTYEGTHNHDMLHVKGLNNCLPEVCHRAENTEDAGESAKTIISTIKESPSFGKASIGDESRGSDAKNLVEVSREAEGQGQQPECTEDGGSVIDLTISSPPASKQDCSFSSDKNKSLEVEDDDFVEIWDLNDDVDEAKSESWNCTGTENKGVISTKQDKSREAFGMHIAFTGHDFKEQEELNDASRKTYTLVNRVEF